MLSQVVWFSLLTAVATGVGALPFFVWKHIGNRWVGIGNALAAGFMIGASALLLRQGAEIDGFGVSLGVLAGIIFIVIFQFFSKSLNADVSTIATKKVRAHQVFLIIAIMTIHSFTEGVGIGVSFSEGAAIGSLIAIAMAIHNIPEGLAISLVLIPRGFSAWKAMLWSIFSSLPQPLMAVPAYYFVETFKSFLAPGLGFAAGAMIWMCLKDLLPEAAEIIPLRKVIVIAAIAAVCMYGLEMLLL